MKDFFPVPPVPPPGEIVVLLIVVIVAAIYDLRYRRIPNWLTASGMLAGLVMNTFLLPIWPGIQLSLLGLATGFGLYFILYALHAMGAGDVKLMGAVGTIVGTSYWFRIFLITAMLGGVMAAIYALLKKRLKEKFWNVGFILSEMMRGRPAYVGREELDVKSEKALRMPHGAIIALGTFVYLALARHYSQ